MESRATQERTLVGHSTGIALMRKQISLLGPQRVPVLIQGETGTGKEVVARALFDAFPRGQFVPVDCGSLVGSLMESELFGHTRGAFTGAGEGRKGLMDLANGGTAFFDEIGDLPLEMQVKLLRLLQEKEFRPVGSLQRTRIDTRILAATHRDLRREVAAGRFREDLFYRLSVVDITITPLRERREDIPLLLEHFLRSANRPHTFSHDAMVALMSYDWPGNVRELRNCVERMVAFSTSTLFQYSDVPPNVVASRGHSSTVTGAFAATVGGVTVRHDTATAANDILPMHEVEIMAIHNALRQTGGDKTESARRLGIGRTTMYRKMRAHGIQPGSSPQNSGAGGSPARLTNAAAA